MASRKSIPTGKGLSDIGIVLFTRRSKERKAPSQIVLWTSERSYSHDQGYQKCY